MSAETPAPLCPRDGSSLEVHRSATAELWSCPECHGIRVEPAALAALLRHDERPPLRFPEVEVERLEGTALCSCPGQPLMDRVVREEDDLSLDICPKCGAHWFDAGELHCYLAERIGAARQSLGEARSIPAVLLEVGMGLIFGLFLWDWPAGDWSGVNAPRINQRTRTASRWTWTDRRFPWRNGGGRDRHIDR